MYIYIYVDYFMYTYTHVYEHTRILSFGCRVWGSWVGLKQAFRVEVGSWVLIEVRRLLTFTRVLILWSDSDVQ